MYSKHYLLTNIGQLNGILTQDVKVLKGREMAEVKSLQNAYLLVENGIIQDFGEMSKVPKVNVETKDLKGKWVMPGFIDSHTHMVFASSRHQEYVMRLKGKTYEEIAASGGGILNSAKKLQTMSEDDLYEHAYKHAIQAMEHGTVALEIKSGYGLSVEAELKMLRVIKRLKSSLPILIKSTFLGAHAFPMEYRDNHQGYIDLIINQMLPIIAKEDLADFVDVFCDKGFYSVDETRQILIAAWQYGLKAKIHGNELGLTGGVQVAVEQSALSVDHLEHVGEEEIELLLSNDTMPVGLPGSSFFLKIPYTPLRKMVDRGLPVAIASDFNPGSSPVYNLWFIWSLSCLYNGLIPEEGFNALTINAARALGIEDMYGSITRGKKASIQVTEAFDHINEMPYWLTQNHSRKVML